MRAGGLCRERPKAAQAETPHVCIPAGNAIAALLMGQSLGMVGSMLHIDRLQMAEHPPYQRNSSIHPPLRNLLDLLKLKGF
jgi:hypothetical protein